MKKIVLTEDMDPVLRVRIVRDEMDRQFPTVDAMLDHIYGGSWQKDPAPLLKEARRLGITSPWETMFDDEKPAPRSRKASARARKPRAVRSRKAASSTKENDKGSRKSSSKH